MPLILELEHASNKLVDLGAPLIGKTVSKTVRVINKSAAAVNVIFELYDRLPYFKRAKKMLSSEFEMPERKKP